LAKVLPERLIADKEERPVPFYPAAHTAAVLITLELGFLQAVEKISRVKIVVTMEEIKTPMIVVRARLTNDIHLPTRVPSKLSTISISFNAKLFYGLHAEDCAGSAASRAVGKIVLWCAVEQVNIRSGILSVNTHRETVSYHRTAVTVCESDHSRLEQRQVCIVATIQRKVANRLLGHEITEFSGLRIHQGLTAIDREVGGQRTDFHHELHGGGVVYGKVHIRKVEGFETGKLGMELIHADGHPGKNEPSFVFARSSPRKPSIALGRCDLNANHHRAVCVPDSPSDVAVSLGVSVKSKNKYEAHEPKNSLEVNWKRKLRKIHHKHCSGLIMRAIRPQ